ncbi:helix-turn-helix domain-containing protein [Hyphomicrobium facile]|uniref:helix-turn-helix domain-containing protein n=1 Tax=Hyphomicrobium facile TaxID=51670 RepID=UPI0015A5580B|nr:helix-turn-helix domain-containing protein [Hyphomicrobium facile]
MQNETGSCVRINDDIGIGAAAHFCHSDLSSTLNLRPDLGNRIAPDSPFPSLAGVNPLSEGDLGKERACLLDTIALDNGTISQMRSSPSSAGGVFDIAPSSSDYFAICYVRSGEITIKQNDRIDIVSEGDFVVIDGARRPMMTAAYPASHELVVLMIPKEQYALVDGAETELGNVVVGRRNAMSPIFSCLAMIADGMHGSSKERLLALYRACVVLLPLTAGLYDRIDGEETGADRHHLLPRILQYLNRNLPDPELSPPGTAKRFGISVRYLHRLFEVTGTTFNSYILARRLDHIREELIAPPSHPQAIAAVARKWGFTKVATFNKAFRKHFGCSPSQFRRGASLTCRPRKRN